MRKKMSELDKLERWLKKNNITYERFKDERIIFHNDPRVVRNQILIKRNNIDILSFICHYGSYGSQQGLIECYDFQNEPKGWLTAEQCKRIIKRKRGI